MQQSSTQPSVAYTPQTGGQQPVIDVQHLTKSFGGIKVLDNLSFQVFPGETFGLLGTNGSGKTTIIRCLLDIHTPNGGKALINGKPFNREVSNYLGYLPEERGLYVKETPISVMTYFGQLKGLSAAVAKQWSYQYLERVELADKAKTRIQKLSGGQQQKIQLGVTIINNPSLLILDEPTKGFDPINRQLLLNIVQERKDAGATVVFISHDMNEVERLCDRVLLLKDGNAAAYGTLREVRAQHGGYHISVTHANPISDAVLLQATNFGGSAAGSFATQQEASSASDLGVPQMTSPVAQSISASNDVGAPVFSLLGHPNIPSVEFPTQLTSVFGIQHEEHIPHFLTFLQQHHVNITAFAPSLPSMHDVFTKIYQQAPMEGHQ